MLKNSYEISLQRILSLSVFVILLIYHYWYAQETSWYSEEYMQAAFTLEVVTGNLDAYGMSPPGLDFYDIAYLLYPLLLLSTHLLARLAFYIAFVLLTYVIDSTYSNLHVLGFLSQTLFSLVVVALGFLLYSDLRRFSTDKRKLFNRLQTKEFRIFIFMLAAIVVLTSAFGWQAEKQAAVNEFFLRYADFSTEIEPGTPYYQLGLFLLLSVGVFLPKEKKILPVALSWLALSITTGLRVESPTYFLIGDVYILLSAMLVWSTLRDGKADQLNAKQPLKV